MLINPGDVRSGIDFLVYSAYIGHWGSFSSFEEIFPVCPGDLGNLLDTYALVDAIRPLGRGVLPWHHLSRDVKYIAIKLI